MKKSVSVVIPNYNGERLLAKNLPSVVRALERAEVPYEIIIPDDNSKDGSVAFLEKNYPQVRVIKGDVNLGFSGNINRGLREARYDLVLMLNSDVELSEDYLLHQFAYFNEPDVFGVMGALKDPRTDQIIVGAKIARQNFFGNIDSTKNILTNPPAPLPTFYLSGANALVDREKLARIGYFNEIYSPFYKEDTDLSLMAWRKGWRCLFEPRAIGYHESSSTIGSSHRRKFIKYISRRNKYIFHYLHLSGVKRALFFALTGLDVLIRWVVVDVTFYSSFWAFIRRLGTLSKMRARHQRELRPTQDVLFDLEREQKAPNAVIF